jgi:hypothetical protein
MTELFTEDSHVYCLWFVPFDEDNNFFAAMINDKEGDRVIYRFEDSVECNYFMIGRGSATMKDFRRAFNLTVEEFCASTDAPMEYLPIDGGIERALSIIEKQPWAEEILPR